MYISFKSIDNVLYPVLSLSENVKNSLTYDIHNKKSAELVISLLESSKGIFIFLDESDDELILSKNHYEKNESCLFINRSYLSFWRKNLLHLSSYSTQSLFNSI